MSLPKRITAVALLLGWLFATGHVASEHGGMVAKGAKHEAAVSHLDDHHDHAPRHDSHLHDLTAAAQAVRSVIATTVWVPLCDMLVERLAAMLREAAEPRSGIGLGDSAHDQRASGWLLVCHTAHPVRGPSLV